MSNKNDVLADRDLSKERDARVIPVAIELLRRLSAQDDIPVGATREREKETAVFFQNFYQNHVIPLAQEHDLLLADVSYIFRLMFQPLELLRDVTAASIEMNRDLAEARLYGLKDIDELSLNMLDKVLRETSDVKDRGVGENSADATPLEEDEENTETAE